MHPFKASAPEMHMEAKWRGADWPRLWAHCSVSLFPTSKQRDYAPLGKISLDWHQLAGINSSSKQATITVNLLYLATEQTTFICRRCSTKMDDTHSWSDWSQAGCFLSWRPLTYELPFSLKQWTFEKRNHIIFLILKTSACPWIHGFHGIFSSWVQSSWKLFYAT